MFIDIDPDFRDIVPLTYGVVPRDGDPSKPYRLTVDSAVAASAAAKAYRYLETCRNLANRSSLRVRKTSIYIPGAMFYGEVCDAELMRNHITHPMRKDRISPQAVITTRRTLNTVTQIENVATMQSQYQIDRVLLICSLWQEEDAKALARNFGLEGQVVTDKEILGNEPGYKKYFEYLENYNPTFRLKRDGLQAKIFRVLNEIDRKGRLRVALSRRLGVGIADWDYRGLEGGVAAHLATRADRIAEMRELHHKPEGGFSRDPLALKNPRKRAI